MIVRFALSIIMLIVVPHACLGQDIELAMRKKIVVGDGPFEVKDEGGVIGFVVAMQGNIVTFKPCIGDTFSLASERLLPTKNKCKNAPSPDGNALVANCNDAWDGWNKTKVAAAVKGTETVGTILSSAGDDKVIAQAMNPEQVIAAFDGVAELQDCGQYTIGINADGKVNLSIIQSRQAIQFDNLQ